MDERADHCDSSAARRGNDLEPARAIGTIFGRHGHRYRDAARRLLRDDARAEEAVQDVAVKLLEQPPPTLTPAYVYVCVVNHCRDLIRADACARRRRDEAVPMLSSLMDQAGHTDESDDARTRVHELLRRHHDHLTRRQRHILQLKLERKTDRQIARKLRIAPKTVAEHYRAAVRTLRKRERERIAVVSGPVPDELNRRVLALRAAHVDGRRAFIVRAGFTTLRTAHPRFSRGPTRTRTS